MDDKVILTKEEFNNLNERIKKLATEKSYLQLFTHLMSEMNEASGLEDTIQNLLQIILKNIGGSNLIIYYLIDEEIYYADVLGVKKRVEQIFDDVVKKVFETKEPVDISSEFGDTKLLSDKFGKAHTWAFPLIVGSDLIGVFKIENLYTGTVDIHFHLPTFFNYASHILKNEILGQSRIKAAFDQLSEENILRKNAERELRIINEELENRVEERTVELHNVNQLLEDELAVRQQAEQQIKSQYLLLSALINSPDDIIIFSLDRNYCYTAFNEQHRLEVKKVWNVDIKVGTCLLDCMPLPKIKELAKISMDRTLKGEAFNEIQHQPGPGIYYEFSWNPIFQNEEVIGLTCFVRDITERKRSEAQILKLNRIHAVLSNINEAIVRVHDKQSLLDSVCRIAVEQGKFRMVWIGMVNHETNKIDVLASNGVAGDYLEKINIDLSDEERCKGPSGTAIKTRKYKISNNIVNDQIMIPWREDAIKYGYKSSASFPLIVFGKAVGVFNVYSDENDFFQEDDIKLLDETAKDISFALEYLENESERKRAEVLLQKSDALLNTTQQITKVGGWEFDVKTGKSFWTEELYRIHEIPNDPSIDHIQESLKCYGPEERKIIHNAFQHACEQGEPYDLELPFTTSTGKALWIRTTTQPVYENSKVVRLVGNVMDITERKKTEALLEESRKHYQQIVDISQDLIVIHQNGIIVFVNEQGVKLAGASSADQIIGKSVLEFVPSGKKVIAEDRIRNAQTIENGKSPLYEQKLLRLDGTEIDIELQGMPVTFRGEKSLMFVARDITERKRNAAINASRLHLLQFAVSHTLDELLEETLNESEKLTGSLIGFFHFVEDDQINLTLQNWSTNTKAKFCKAVGKGFHYPINEAGVWVDCVHQGKPVIHNDYASLPNKKGLPEGHAAIIRELVVPVLRGKNVKAILGVGNKPTGYIEKDIEAISLLADLAWEIAERKKAEEALIESEERYRLIAENTADTISILDLNLKPIYISPAVYKLRGFTVEEALALEMNQILSPESLQKAKDVLSKQMELEALGKADPSRTILLELEMYCKDGSTLWVEMSASFLRDKNLKPINILTVTRDITKRKQAEQALLDNKQRLDNIITNSPGAVYRCANDPDWTMEFLSEGINLIAGYPAEEFLNNCVRSYASIIHPDDFQSVKEAVENGLKYNEKFEIDYRLVAADGTLHWVQEQGRGVYSADGKLLCLDGVILDITDRKRIEQELLNNQKLFIAGNTVVFKWKAAEGWPVEYVSPNISVQFGYNPEDFLSGKIPYASIVHSDDLQRIGQEVMAHSNAGVTFFEQEYRIVRSDGEFRWIYDYTTIIRDDNGKITHYYGYIIDITERKRAEEALHQAAEEIRDLYNRAPCGYHSLDKNSVIVRMNDTELEWLGYTYEEVIGKKKFLEILTAESKEVFKKYFPVFMEQGWIKDLEFDVIRKDGSIFPILLNATAIKDSNGNFLMSRSTIFDITERKRLESTLFFIAQQGWMNEKENFFDALVQFLGVTLSLDYVIIDKIEENPEIAETVALYAKGSVVPNMSYALKGTPCENVMGKRLCFYPQNVQQIFPEDKLLVEMGVESYIGIPLWDSIGQPIGLIALMGCKPIQENKSTVQILQLVATRVAAELEYQKNDRMLRMREREFRTLAENIPHHIMRYDINGKVTYLNHQNAASDYSDSSFMGQRPVESKFKNAEDVAKYQENLIKVLKTGEPIEMEIVLTDLNDKDHNYAVTFIAERDSNGLINGAMAIGQDITERKHSELELREQMNEINRFNKLMLGREEKMIELKKEINLLLVKEGKPKKYDMQI
jgi:PAS domain S-box-containing protein